MPLSISISEPKVNKNKRFVYISQLSGVQPIGGVTLEIQNKEG
jgi:hypothetical protein